MNNNLVRTKDDILAVAKTMFPCQIRETEDRSSDNRICYRLCVGKRPNPSYNPNADPNRPGISETQKLIEKRNSKVFVPDIRVLWLPPIIERKELIEKHLLPIQKSLISVVPESEEIEKKVKSEETDDDLLEKMSGSTPDKNADIEMEKVEEENEEEEIVMEDDELGESPENRADIEQIMAALKDIADNVEVLSGDIKSLSTDQLLLKKRLDSMGAPLPTKFPKKAGKGRGRPPKIVKPEEVVDNEPESSEEQIIDDDTDFGEDEDI